MGLMSALMTEDRMALLMEPWWEFLRVLQRVDHLVAHSVVQMEAPKDDRMESI